MSDPVPDPTPAPTRVPTPGTGRTAYAVAYLRDIDLGPALVSYLERIDRSLEPFGGRFLVHGGELQPIEGLWNGDLVVIEFPSRRAAHEWYASPDYQDILPLRLQHTRSMAAIVDGVPPGYTARQGLAILLAG